MVARVQVPLAVAELGEPVGERKGEQEAEQDLDAQSGHAQLLQQLGQVAVISLGLGLVPLIRQPGSLHRSAPPAPKDRLVPRPGEANRPPALTRA
jgi:hypothetical protein